MHWYIVHVLITVLNHECGNPDYWDPDNYVL